MDYETRRSIGTVASPTEATYVEKCCRRSADALESAGQEAHDKILRGGQKVCLPRWCIRTWNDVRTLGSAGTSIQGGYPS